MIKLIEDSLTRHCLAQRASALNLLDRGLSHRQVTAVLLINHVTVCQLRWSLKTQGVEGLTGFDFGDRHAFLSDEQQAELVAWVSAILPRNTHKVAAVIEKRFGVSFARRSGLIALLHSFSFVYRKQLAMASKSDSNNQRDLIATYDNLSKHQRHDDVSRSGACRLWNAADGLLGGA